jgi:hypothetical protein
LEMIFSCDGSWHPRQCGETKKRGTARSQCVEWTYSRLARLVLFRSATASSFAPLSPIVLLQRLWVRGRAEAGQITRQKLGDDLRVRDDFVTKADLRVCAEWTSSSRRSCARSLEINFS